MTEEPFFLAGQIYVQPWWLEPIAMRRLPTPPVAARAEFGGWRGLQDFVQRLGSDHQEKVGFVYVNRQNDSELLNLTR